MLIPFKNINGKQILEKGERQKNTTTGISELLTKVEIIKEIKSRHICIIRNLERVEPTCFA